MNRGRPYISRGAGLLASIIATLLIWATIIIAGLMLPL